MKIGRKEIRQMIKEALSEARAEVLTERVKRDRVGYPDVDYVFWRSKGPDWKFSRKSTFEEVLDDPFGDAAEGREGRRFAALTPADRDRWMSEYEAADTEADERRVWDSLLAELERRYVAYENIESVPYYNREWWQKNWRDPFGAEPPAGITPHSAHRDSGARERLRQRRRDEFTMKESMKNKNSRLRRIINEEMEKAIKEFKDVVEDAAAGEAKEEPENPRVATLQREIENLQNQIEKKQEELTRITSK
jgi:hypothetical protein